MTRYGTTSRARVAAGYIGAMSTWAGSPARRAGAASGVFSTSRPRLIRQLKGQPR
jgi:hypothetical protein